MVPCGSNRCTRDPRERASGAASRRISHLSTAGGPGASPCSRPAPKLPSSTRDRLLLRSAASASRPSADDGGPVTTATAGASDPPSSTSSRRCRGGPPLAAPLPCNPLVHATPGPPFPSRMALAARSIGDTPGKAACTTCPARWARSSEAKRVHCRRCTSDGEERGHGISRCAPPCAR